MSLHYLVIFITYLIENAGMSHSVAAFEISDHHVQYLLLYRRELLETN